MLDLVLPLRWEPGIRKYFLPRLSSPEAGFHPPTWIAYVHPRTRNSTNNIGIGMPMSQRNTHPIAPRSV